MKEPAWEVSRAIACGGEKEPYRNIVPKSLESCGWSALPQHWGSRRRLRAGRRAHLVKS